MDFLYKVSSPSRVQNLWMHSALFLCLVHHDQSTFDGLVCDSTLHEPCTLIKSLW